MRKPEMTKKVVTPKYDMGPRNLRTQCACNGVPVKCADAWASMTAHMEMPLNPSKDGIRLAETGAGVSPAGLSIVSG